MGCWKQLSWEQQRRRGRGDACVTQGCGVDVGGAAGTPASRRFAGWMSEGPWGRLRHGGLWGGHPVSSPGPALGAFPRYLPPDPRMLLDVGTVRSSARPLGLPVPTDQGDSWANTQGLLGLCRGRSHNPLSHRSFAVHQAFLGALLCVSRLLGMPDQEFPFWLAWVPLGGRWGSEEGSGVA